MFEVVLLVTTKIPKAIQYLNNINIFLIVSLVGPIAYFLHKMNNDTDIKLIPYLTVLLDEDKERQGQRNKCAYYVFGTHTK